MFYLFRVTVGTWHPVLFGDAVNRIDNVAVTFDVESLA